MFLCKINSNLVLSIEENVCSSGLNCGCSLNLVCHRKQWATKYPTILYYVLWLEEWVVKELIILCLFPQKIAGCIKYFRKSEAPSIPSQGQAFGYEEAEDGTLIKFSQPVRDSSLGPAYYQTVYVSNFKRLDTVRGFIGLWSWYSELPEPKRVLNWSYQEQL